MISGMTANEIFVKNADQMRVVRKLSKAQLAELSGMYREGMSLILRGKTGITISTAEKIASALDVPIASLFLKNFDPQKYVVKEFEEI